MTWLEYSLLGFLALMLIWIGRDLFGLRYSRRRSVADEIPGPKVPAVTDRALRLNPNFLRRLK